MKEVILIPRKRKNKMNEQKEPPKNYSLPLGMGNYKIIFTPPEKSEPVPVPVTTQGESNG